MTSAALNTSSTSPTLPPEIFPIIAAFVPLRSAPGTLRAVALANRVFYNICRPLLYSRLILRNEDDAIAVMQRIRHEPQLGLFVTEIYIMSELSVKARKRKKPFDVVAGLQMLVARGLLPRIIALGLYMLGEWVHDKNFNVILCGRLLPKFWISLRNECPRLRTLLLRNVGHSFMDPWVKGRVIDEITNFSDLSILRLEWIQSGGPKEDDNLKILNNLPRLASSLHTLSLTCNLQDATFFLSLHFPHLTFLRLCKFQSLHDTEKVQGFFERHAQLESLSLEECSHTWFSMNIKVGFLPNLKHLKARFEDIRPLEPILPQLVSLVFTQSYNAQILYLLCAVLPNGLPNLKSLEIEQSTPPNWDGYHHLEGVLWHDTLDGQVYTEKRRRKVVERDFLDGYMCSIARGAPNVEELGLHGMYLSAASLEKLGPTLGQFLKMQRFYYHGYSPDPKYASPPHPRNRKKLLADFLASAEALGRVCPRLESVTSIDAKTLPYISGAIERNSDGEVVAVREVEGVGMLMSADDNDPFPCNN